MEESPQIKKSAFENQQNRITRPKILLRCDNTHALYDDLSTIIEETSSGPTTQMSDKDSELRCDPDPFHPGLAQCTADVDDDRQGISHFFGRNKKATASIPQNCFPLMCRVHYQEKGYRWGKKSPGVFADFQCGCIVKTLQAMTSLTFTDEQSNSWPWFCGLILQIPMPKGRRTKTNKPISTAEFDNRESSLEHQDSSVDPESQDKYEASLSSVPVWLRDFVTKNPSDTRYDASEHPNGVQYNITQVIAIVRSLGKHCVDNEAKLPKIEAIPVTLGMHFEQELDKIKKNVKELTIKRDRATTNLRNAISKTARDVAGEEFEQADDALELAENDLDLAQIDFDATAHMIPATRITKKKVLADKSILQTRLPPRDKSKVDDICIIRETAAKVFQELEEDHVMDEHVEDELIDSLDEDIPVEALEVLEEGDLTDEAGNIDLEGLEAGEIHENSDAETVSTQVSLHQADTETTSSKTISKVSHSKKRTIQDVDARTGNGYATKRPRHFM